MAKIVLDQVTKVFGNEVIAVNDVSLEIGDGEFMVLVGPSGCGKSTILRILAGLEEVTAGEVIIGDRQVTDLLPKDRDIAMVFQNYALYPHMTRRAEPGVRPEAPQDAEGRACSAACTDAARILGLEPLLQRKPAALSGGQRQRVAMGRAMVREPHAFLMDEPLSNLDAKLRVQMRAELARLRDRLKTTTLYVTHDQVEAMTLGDRVAVLKDGVLQQVDTPQRLFNAPGQPVRRGVHRLAAHEPGRGHGATASRARSADAIALGADGSAWPSYAGPPRDPRASVRPTSRTRKCGATSDLPTIEVTADVTEELGSEVHVIFTDRRAARR